MVIPRKGKEQASNGNPFDVQSRFMVKGERAMIRVDVTLLVLLSMAVSHNRAFAAEPQRPVKKVQGFGSPTEAWEAFAKAGEARDWGSVYDCFTPVAQDKMTFDCLLGLKFGVAWFNLEKSDDKELRSLADNCDRLYAAHGIDWKRIEKESEKAEKKDLDREDLQQLLLPLVRDKRQFFVDATTLTITVQETIGKKMEAKGMKARPEKKVKPEETPPPGLDKLVKIKTHGDRATAEIARCLSDSTTLIVGGKQVRYQTETKFFRRIDGRWYIAADQGEPVDAPLHKIVESEIPYRKQFSMEAGDVLRFELPGGKDVAVWCEGGAKNSFAAEQTTDSGLKTSWGEKPFKHVGYKRVRLPDGGTTFGETNSYIKQGGVTTSTGEGTSTYQLFVDRWEFDIIEDLRAEEKLPVTVQVRPAAEKELLRGDAKRDHYVKQLKSADVAERLAAIGELQEMAFMGDTYAGDPKDMIAAMRPLTEDRDPKIQAAARLYLCQVGDEKSLLALVTPEPKGEWRGIDGASRIADWCVRHKCPALSKHVLTFFESKDEALLAFAVTFFARTDDPESKPQMLAVLKHKSPDIRTTAVPAIRFLCTPKETAGYLVPLLHDPSKRVVLAALLEAGWVNQAIPVGEITRLLKDADPVVREMAAHALDCCRDPAAVVPLLEATKDSDARVRAQAAVTLGRIATPKAYDRLLELLRDDNAEVRVQAINGLRWLGDVRAIPHLLKMLKEEKDHDTQSMAERTIRELNSK